ncbi:hypothetical protein I6N90_07690 [Paenibacillus sp. GSMTC-2017]|uniref:hypothetical protein n=1 Tax=Paenibacillus sp. GSMTC-2017 TaxID=2794350 RepID=UPI0018D87D63|nr:hypothetical protein [Paenibacillus sp. GSMTC-2017]MBH5317682.1 hypothetical protein [Paenibacillus sp. GSMTC-2017]
MTEKEKRKFRIEQLKRKIKVESYYGVLFNECICSLGTETRVYNLDESIEISRRMEDAFGFSSRGKVD